MEERELSFVMRACLSYKFKLLIPTLLEALLCFIVRSDYYSRHGLLVLVRIFRTSRILYASGRLGLYIGTVKSASGPKA